MFIHIIIIDTGIMNIVLLYHLIIHIIMSMIIARLEILLDIIINTEAQIITPNTTAIGIDVIDTRSCLKKASLC